MTSTGGLDIAAAEAYLDGLADEAERRRDSELTAMRARCEIPAPLGGLVRIGLPLVWASLRWEDDGRAEVRFAFQDERGAEAYAWGRAWPRRGALVEPGDLLSRICAAWPTLARARLRGEPDPQPAAPADPDGLPLEFAAVPEEGIRLEAGGRVRRFGAEGVLVLEVLSGLADLLADRLGEGDATSARWAALRALTDLPPMEIEGDGEGARDPFPQQTAWYAGHLGLDVGPYSLAAVSVHARQVLHGYLGVPEPDAGEWEPDHLPGDLDPESVMGLARRAAAEQGEELPRFLKDAVAVRNIDARQRILYGLGPGGAFSA
jgi:hypothetical protein